MYTELCLPSLTYARLNSFFAVRTDTLLSSQSYGLTRKDGWKKSPQRYTHVNVQTRASSFISRRVHLQR